MKKTDIKFDTKKITIFFVVLCMNKAGHESPLKCFLFKISRHNQLRSFHCIFYLTHSEMDNHS